MNSLRHDQIKVDHLLFTQFEPIPNLVDLKWRLGVQSAMT